MRDMLGAYGALTIVWERDWRGLERELSLAVSPGDGGGLPGTRLRGHVRGPLGVASCGVGGLIHVENPRGSVSGGSCMVYGGMFIGAFLGRSSLGMAASGLLTVSVGG